MVFFAGEPPLFTQGKAQFDAWLSFHKQKWKLQKKIRNARKTSKVNFFIRNPFSPIPKLNIFAHWNNV